MRRPGTQVAFATAILLGSTGLTIAAVAQSAAFPPGTNCMMLTANQRPACLTQAQQQGSVPPAPVGAPSGGANAQNATSANPSMQAPSALAGPNTTVAPNTAGPNTTVAPNTASPSANAVSSPATGQPIGGTTNGIGVNASQSIPQNAMPNTVTPGSVAPNAVVPGGTQSPNSVTTPLTGPTTPVIIPNAATTTGGTSGVSGSTGLGAAGSTGAAGGSAGAGAGAVGN